MQAAKSAFPNRGRFQYKTLNTCPIRWEEDELLVEPELARLDIILQDYGFTTKKWQIPMRNSHLGLMIKTGEFIWDADNDNNLFIRPELSEVYWSAIQTLFAEAQSDVLILLDACAAASATTRSLRGSMEAIMACGFESKAPSPGEHPFTNTLINVLEDWIDRRSFLASCLQAEILSELKLKENKKGREGKERKWCSLSVPTTAFGNAKINDPPPVHSSSLEIPHQQSSQPTPTSSGPGPASHSYDEVLPRQEAVHANRRITININHRKIAAVTNPTPPQQGAQTISPIDRIEIFKSVYVNMEDPCYVILLAALRKYKINAS
ncbi:hypothetical protein LCER1_G002872 [Lachnellula cervina]|uniref:Uncharacterized protein n=1 Tax=Lachnellula cervina TaxID=1316786 RepID=A0A7D8YWD1_9HELO|nr:hypothetical protein LCER1_G002872 [Lachnellula cervina]